ncbi:MAG: GTPase HflX, partial [Acidimicrobiia bacterium]|nr:GTPase HflX [Acidimicrobiia bacterium]
MTQRGVGRDRTRLTATVTDVGVRRQRALLVALITGDRTTDQVEASLDELERLVDTAGSDSVERAVQRRPHPDPATYIGKGKAAELAGIGAALDIDLVVVDGELSPVQQRNLQKLLQVDVVDRVALILDIFALHATSRAGMAQVELAMNRYRLPRLRGKGIEMSRLGGGIGTRGPGETKLESDRRRVQMRISQLERELKDLATTRATQRKARRRAEIPSAAIVGYTNAGKSSLLNALTGAGVLVEDRLFSTLDATVRRLQVAPGKEVLLSDTVGFVRDLPHDLVEAFRSTLEEAVDTDLLVHIVDAAADDPEQQIGSVRETLQEIGAHDLPELLVLNKIDVADPVAVARLRALHPEAVALSAAQGTGLDELRERLETLLVLASVDFDILVPFDRGDVVSLVHRVGEVLSESHEPEGTRIKGRVPARYAESV